MVLVLEYNKLTYQLCGCWMFILHALYAKSVLGNWNWLETIKNLFMSNTNLCVMMQIVCTYSRLNVGKRDTQKTSTKLKTKNGNIVVKQEEDQTKVQEQLNVSNVLNASNISTGSGNSRGSQKKKKNNNNKNLVLSDKQKQKEILS